MAHLRYMQSILGLEVHVLSTYGQALGDTLNYLTGQM